MVHELMVRASGDCAASHRFDFCSDNPECCFREAYLLTDNNVTLVSLYTEINITLLHPTTLRQVQSQEGRR